MEIFILEDSAERIKFFKKTLESKHNLTFSDNVEEAKKLLQVKKYDVIFFDHDLDNKVFVSSNDPNTGYQLAKWIEEKGMRFDQVVIHSLNPVGAERIKKRAENFSDNVEKIPFTVLIRKLRA